MIANLDGTEFGSLHVDRYTSSTSEVKFLQLQYKILEAYM
jgi:hypothetical protein